MIAAIGAMQSGKACGLDGTCTELFKDCVPSFAPLMTALFNACLSAGRVSDTMMRGVVTLLFKAGDRRDPSKYRPITLLNKTMSSSRGGVVSAAPTRATTHSTAASSLTDFLSPPSSTSTATVTFPTFCTMLYVTPR